MSWSGKSIRIPYHQVWVLYCVKPKQTTVMLFLFWCANTARNISSIYKVLAIRDILYLLVRILQQQWVSFSLTHTPPWSVHCAHRCVSSPRCWSPWRPPHWCCWRPESRGSGGSSGCSRWWPHSRTWGCTWWPSPETGGSRCAWRESHRNHGWARTETETKRAKEFSIFTTDARQMY